jgi:hypothetical protein
MLEREGIAIGRVAFESRLPRPRYMERFNSIDIALDTYPYNGHTTGLDGLWMGVPAISLYGQSVVSRAGLSQLTNLAWRTWPLQPRVSLPSGLGIWRWIATAWQNFVARCAIAWLPAR